MNWKRYGRQQQLIYATSPASAWREYVKLQKNSAQLLSGPIFEPRTPWIWINISDHLAATFGNKSKYLSYNGTETHKSKTNCCSRLYVYTTWNKWWGNIHNNWSHYHVRSVCYSCLHWWMSFSSHYPYFILDLNSFNDLWL